MFYLGTIGTVYDITARAVAAATSMNSAAAAIAPQVTGINSVARALYVLSAMEREAAIATNKVAAKAVNGVVPAQYQAAYDGLRHALQGAQRATLDTLRQQLANQFGRAESDRMMAGIGFPAWLPRGDQMRAVEIGSAPIFIGPRAEAYSAGHDYSDATVLTFTEAVAKCIVVGGIARSVGSVVAYNGGAGSGPAPTREELEAFRGAERLSRTKRALAIGIPVAVGALAIGGLAWFLIRRRRKAGTSGLSKSRPRRALRGATRLNTLTDSVPSRYNLEV